MELFDFNTFLKAFIPMFIAVDVIGSTPFVISITEGIAPRARRKLIIQSVITASCVAVIFIVGGQALLRFLGVELYDFLIAGGVIIFLISSADLLSPHKSEVEVDPHVGVVPIGTPLLAGPAVLTTAIITLGTCGTPATLAAVLVNFVIAGIVFISSDLVVKILGKSGTRALSKVMALVMCAYGIMMIRNGVIQVLAELAK